MRPTLAVVLALLACSSKDTSSGKPSGEQSPMVVRAAAGKLLTAEQVCDALTPDDVEAEMHVKTVAHLLPKSGEYSAPSCGWFAADAPDAPDARRLSITMFFHDNAARSKELFDDKLESICNLGRHAGSGSAGSDAGSGSAGSDAGSGSAGSDAGSGSASRLGGLEVTGLADGARFCGGLWVLKGSSFFVVSLGRGTTGTRDERIAMIRHLAERVLPRLP